MRRYEDSALANKNKDPEASMHKTGPTAQRNAALPPAARPLNMHRPRSLQIS